MGVVGAMGDGGRMRRMGLMGVEWGWGWWARAVGAGVKKVLGRKSFVVLLRASPTSSCVPLLSARPPLVLTPTDRSPNPNPTYAFSPNFAPKMDPRTSSKSPRKRRSIVFPAPPLSSPSSVLRPLRPLRPNARPRHTALHFLPLVLLRTDFRRRPRRSSLKRGARAVGRRSRKGAIGAR